VSVTILVGLATGMARRVRGSLWQDPRASSARVNALTTAVTPLDVERRALATDLAAVEDAMLRLESRMAKTSLWSTRITGRTL
jgi:hypothetical protein